MTPHWYFPKLKNLGPRAHRWLHSMLNVCFTKNRIPKVWRQSEIIATLKPEKDSAIPKSYRPISLLCHMYKLYECIILNRIASSVDRHLIKEQAGFRPWKSCCSQLMNLTPIFLRNIVDLPCRPGFNNSLDGGDCLHGGHCIMFWVQVLYK